MTGQDRPGLDGKQEEADGAGTPGSRAYQVRRSESVQKGKGEMRGNTHLHTHSLSLLWAGQGGHHPFSQLACLLGSSSTITTTSSSPSSSSSSTSIYTQLGMYRHTHTHLIVSYLVSWTHQLPGFDCWMQYSVCTHTPTTHIRALAISPLLKEHDLTTAR